MPSTITIASVLFAAALSCACAPLPMRVYVADAPQSALVYSQCSFNTHVPVAVRLTAGPVWATLSLLNREGRSYVQLQFDIPSGVTVTLDDDSVSLNTSNPSSVTKSRFPSVSLVDTPILNSYSNAPEVQRQQFPVPTPRRVIR